MRPGKVLRAVLAGIVAGILVLGLLGRAAMAMVEAATSDAATPSTGDVLEVVAISALLGALGGLLLLAPLGIPRSSRLVRGPAVGIVLLAGTLLVSWISGWIGPDAATVQPVTLLVALLTYVAFGACADAMLALLKGAPDRPARHSPAADG